ncbi:hypothetical protein SCLCIDRAFT_885490 [Scleroderma citrinum Foug A]|uniref:Golgi apparatus membrane protein TVP38 n=1 Tax=Scleroderma citrinum Foug A TaxID=1036808 RepID=A0A0C3E785_9AGAM|nr:hypothetical protein SCLCIDRAFT_885490 [Scleroderma citrinum Foug A]
MVYDALPVQAIVWFLVFFYGCLIALILLVTPSRIAQFVYDLAQRIRHVPYGSLVLMIAVVIASFPPFIGHSTLMNVYGFTYGLQGFVPAAISTIAGSAAAFVTLRHLFRDRLRQWTSTNDNWQALESVIRAKGLGLIILIRVSPFPPWVYSNSLFAGIEAVSLAQFALATLFVLPRVLVFIFIGSRIASLSDGEQRSQMDAQTKFINFLVIIGSVVISLVVSSILYSFMKKEVAAIHTDSSRTDDYNATVLDDTEQNAPLLTQHLTDVQAND